MKTFLAILAAIITTAAAEQIRVKLKSGEAVNGLLVGKSQNEIRIEHPFGIITLQSQAVTPESWATAQRTNLSIPTQKVEPKPQPKPPKSVPKIIIDRPPTTISAATIEKAYAENPIAADQKYKGKPIAVRGIITSIDTDVLGAPYVGIGKITKYYPKSAANEVARLKVGQQTTLTGNCLGQRLSIVVIRD